MSDRNTPPQQTPQSSSSSSVDDSSRPARPSDNPPSTPNNADKANSKPDTPPKPKQDLDKDQPKPAAPQKAEESVDDTASKRPGEIIVDPTRAASTRTIDPGDKVDEPKWGTARFTPQMMLELRLVGATERFNFRYEELDQILIGREDPATGTKPEVNLSPYGALDKGVSRRHATIVRDSGALSIVDQGSPNGTFLNGQKLVSQQPRILRDGDEISVGQIDLRVNFRRAN